MKNCAFFISITVVFFLCIDSSHGTESLSPVEHKSSTGSQMVRGGTGLIQTAHEYEHLLVVDHTNQ